MDEQLFDGDVVEARVARSVGGGLEPEQGEGPVGEGKRAGVDQGQDGDGGDRFRDAGAAEERVRLDGFLPIDVRQSIAAVEHQPAVLGHRQLPAGEAPRRHERGHDLVETGQLRHVRAGHGDGLGLWRGVGGGRWRGLTRGGLSCARPKPGSDGGGETRAASPQRPAAGEAGRRRDFGRLLDTGSIHGRRPPL